MLRRILVGILMVLGMGLIIYGVRRYFMVLRWLEKGEFLFVYCGVVVLGIVMGVLCGGVLVGIVRGWSDEKKEIK